MNKRSLISGAALSALAWSPSVLAQDPTTEQVVPVGDEGTAIVAPATWDILVLASRGAPVAAENFAGSQTRISARDLTNRQTRDIAEILRDVPGVAISAVAGQTQLRLRGSEANHVLVLIDGIEVSDPFAGEFDLGTLQAEIGSRIEVLRGPQSALYGSDAIGGVVAYSSARGDEAKGLRAFIEGGSDNTINGSARVGLGDQNANLALSATLVSTDGQPNARGGVRDVGRDSYTISGRGMVQASETFALRSALRLVRTEGDFNDQDFDSTSPTFGLTIDSPGVRFRNEAFYALAGAQLATFGDDWTHDLSAQIADIDRDTFASFGRTSGSEGQRLKASYVSAARLGYGLNWHTLTFAADWEKERFRNDDPFGSAFSGWRAIENVGLAGEYRFDGRKANVALAVRHDINSRFADETTLRLGAGYDVSDDTRLRASYGTGIKNPGFFELFGFFDGQFIGNEDLKPEKSESWEVGLDQRLAGGAVTLSATYFESKLKHEIFTTFPAPDFIATPANRETRSKRNGVELSGKAKLGETVTFDFAYTWLDAEENGVEEVRRPGNIASAAVNWTAPGDAASATLIVRHNGETDDLAFTDPSFIPVTERLDDYTLVNLAAEVKLSDELRLFGRVENLLDERYEQVFSFVSPGRTATVGLRAEF